MHIPRNIQAPYGASDFWIQWGSDTPRMVLCIKITSKSEFGSIVVGFTTNTRNMTLPGHGGVTFKSAPAMTPTVVEQGLDEAATMELTGVYTSDTFTQNDVTVGKWNFATVEVFSVCWDNVNLGELLHFKGYVGEIRDYQTYFTCEGRGLISKLSQEVDKVTQRLCRVKEFRDAECGHTAPTVIIASVTYNIEETVLCDGGTQADPFLNIFTAGFAGNVPPAGFYKNGKMTSTNALNNGVSREIAFNDAAGGGSMAIYLKRPFPFDVGDNDAFTLIAGCDRTIEDCMKFTNITRRRAEDWVPGIEAVSRLPQTN